LWDLCYDFLIPSLPTNIFQHIKIEKESGVGLGKLDEEDVNKAKQKVARKKEEAREKARREDLERELEALSEPEINNEL